MIVEVPERCSSHREGLRARTVSMSGRAAAREKRRRGGVKAHLDARVTVLGVEAHDLGKDVLSRLRARGSGLGRGRGGPADRAGRRLDREGLRGAALSAHSPPSSRHEQGESAHLDGRVTVTSVERHDLLEDGLGRRRRRRLGRRRARSRALEELGQHRRLL